MSGDPACVFDEDSSGQETPVGFRDSPGQWYTANHRKRAALSQLEGEPTQRDSQATQVATEALTEVTTQPQDDPAPVFVAATPSEDETIDVEEDEEETQIRMTNSEEQDDVLRSVRKIFEEAVPLPLASVSDAGMGLSDDNGDSDMSDDMLEQDGSVAGLSSIAASFQKREEAPQVVQRKMYKPRTPVRTSPTLSTRDESDSSGGETEIEAEPREESPAKSCSRTVTDEGLTKDGLALRLTKSASFSKAAATESLSPDKTSLQRSLSTPEKTRSSKRNHGELAKDSYTKTKRRRTNGAGKSLKSPEKETPAIDEALHEEPTSPQSTARSQRKKPASRRGRKRAANSQLVTDTSQAEGGSIRIILTGLEPTPATRKKIKAIAGAVYETNIEKATHVIAPQNQLKRTVKLLCGISCCKHILGERWLDESARIGAAADEQANCLHNEEAEDKWQFDLRNTMYSVSSEQRQRLFADFSVFITNHKSVLPPVKDLVKIVECAGGTASCKGKPGASDLVISSEAALATVTVRKTLTQANPERIYSAELILSGILQQRVELDKHRLEL